MFILNYSHIFYIFQIEGPWQPVVESASTLNPEPFLTAAPLDLVKTGSFYRVPWLMGSTSEDGAFFGASKPNDIHVSNYMFVHVEL